MIMMSHPPESSCQQTDLDLKLHWLILDLTLGVLTDFQSKFPGDRTILDQLCVTIGQPLSHLQVYFV